MYFDFDIFYRYMEIKDDENQLLAAWRDARIRFLRIIDAIMIQVKLSTRSPSSATFPLEPP